jgi:hypothetical protein|tara:strand:- start:64 stop:393 length:330 start_codon:yes stop_codon:yes gene_type:complete
MKPVTKENLLEAIQKVEEQGKLTHYAYEDNTGCRCVVGHLMEEQELIKLKEDELNDASIGALLQQSDFISVPKKDSLILARLQSLNDIEDLPVDVFVKEARALVEELFA